MIMILRQRKVILKLIFTDIYQGNHMILSSFISAAMSGLINTAYLITRDLNDT